MISWCRIPDNNARVDKSLITTHKLRWGRRPRREPRITNAKCLEREESEISDENNNNKTTTTTQHVQEDETTMISWSNFMSALTFCRIPDNNARVEKSLITTHKLRWGRRRRRERRITNAKIQSIQMLGERSEINDENNNNKTTTTQHRNFRRNFLMFLSVSKRLTEILYWTGLFGMIWGRIHTLPLIFFQNFKYRFHSVAKLNNYVDKTWRLSSVLWF